MEKTPLRAGFPEQRWWFHIEFMPGLAVCPFPTQQTSPRDLVASLLWLKLHSGAPQKGSMQMRLELHFLPLSPGYRLFPGSRGIQELFQSPEEAGWDIRKSKSGAGEV